MWDKYFFDMCNTVASNSKCLSRKIGAIIVKDKTILSLGYNGPPRGVSHCGKRYFRDKKLIEKIKNSDNKKISIDECPRQALGFKSGEGLEWCVAGHAERNAIINAARHGIAIKDSVLYCNCPIPCTPCLIEIINSGIKEIVVTNLTFYDKMGEYLVKESKIKLRKFKGISK